MPKNKRRHPARAKPSFRTQAKPRFKSHVRAHEEITGNEFWYGDQLPDLGPGFSAAKAKERTSTVLGILLRAAKRAEKGGTGDLAETYYQLHDKLDACRPRSRCGSLACPRCARAFQKAKIAAQDAAIIQASKAKSGRHLVFVTVVPKAMMYSPGKMDQIDIKKANRRLKDAMKKVGNRTMLGSADLGWETRRMGKYVQVKGYVQVHWHLAMWTSNPGNLERKLKPIFQKTKKYERPVEVKITDDRGFLGYMNKAIKLPDLLRTNRKQLPELLLVLDRTEPIDLMVYTQHRLTAQFGRFALRAHWPN
jgi:hypothetical protein